MTPLTGMTAQQAAEELRQRWKLALPSLTTAEAEHLASLLDEEARENASLRDYYDRTHSAAGLGFPSSDLSGLASNQKAVCERLEQGARDTDRLSCAEAILQVAPQAPAGHFAGLDWLDSYRQWWMNRLLGTSELISAAREKEAPRE